MVATGSLDGPVAVMLQAALADATYFFLAAALLPCFGFFDFLSFF
jgi:hypothetical protein